MSQPLHRMDECAALRKTGRDRKLAERASG